MKLIHEFVITPAYDKRSPDSKRNYGVHGCELHFYVLNAARTRCAQFVCHTDWLPRHVQQERMGMDISIGTRFPDVCQVVTGEQPMAADLGYHSTVEMYHGQHQMDCHLLRGKKCYYDGSGLNAERVRDVMLEEGSEGVWRELEAFYREVFDDKKTDGFGELLTNVANAIEEASNGKTTD